MFSAIGEALTNLIPTPIKRLFDGVAGGGNSGNGGNSGGGSGPSKHPRRRQGGGGGSDDDHGPVIEPARGFAGIAHGGTQGLGWYKRTMVRAGGGGGAEEDGAEADGGGGDGGNEDDDDRAHGHFDADECEARHDKARREAAGG